MKNSQVVFWKKQNFLIELSARAWRVRQEEQRGLDLLLGHFIGENRAVPTICLFPVSLCQIWSSCRIGLCGKLRSQMSPEPAQEHFQKWNLSLLVQGCAWAAWQVCSEPGHLQEALSLLRLALRMLCSASRQEGQQGLSLVCRASPPAWQGADLWAEPAWWPSSRSCSQHI